MRGWLETLGVQPLFIEPGSPWENGYVESFNGKLRDELLDREIFYPGFPIWLWYRIARTSRRALISGVPTKDPRHGG